MTRNHTYILFLIVIISSLAITGCKDNSYMDGAFVESKILNYDEFLSELIKVDGITVNFKNFLYRLSEDENSKFKIISTPVKVSDKYETRISFYCLLDNSNDTPRRIIYTDISEGKDKKKKLFHGQVFQYLDSKGSINYTINGDFYNNHRLKGRDLQTKVSVLNKGTANRYLVDKKETPIYRPGLNFDHSLNKVENDFSLSRGEESIINFHILGSPDHYEKIYQEDTISFE